MSYRTRMRAQLKGDYTEVKVLIKHPMKPSSEDKATGEKIKGHYIEEVTFKHNGEVVMSADWGAGVSANPYFSFQFEGGNVGDSVELTWKDNQGNSGKVVTTIID